MGFPGGSAGKESACNVGDLGSMSGLGRSPGEGKDYPLQSSGLETSMDCMVSVQFSCSVVSDSLRPHELQHARPPCPSPTPGVHSDSHPSSQWCHPAVSSSVIPFSSCPQSLPASESFPICSPKALTLHCLPQVIIGESFTKCFVTACHSLPSSHSLKLFHQPPFFILTTSHGLNKNFF